MGVEVSQPRLHVVGDGLDEALALCQPLLECLFLVGSLHVRARCKNKLQLCSAGSFRAGCAERRSAQRAGGSYSRGSRNFMPLCDRITPSGVMLSTWTPSGRESP